jgi:phage shock protein PspC (stress-responsive transcriptional regulator)
MIELSEDIGGDETFDLFPPDVIIDQSESMYNGSINGTLDSFANDFNVSNETMRLLFIAIATITVLVCLTICISVCICICLSRYVEKHMKKEFYYRLHIDATFRNIEVRKRTRKIFNII